MQAKRLVLGLVNFQRRSLVFLSVRQQRFDFVTLCKVKRVFWIQRLGFRIPYFISASFSGLYTDANCLPKMRRNVHAVFQRNVKIHVNSASLLKTRRGKDGDILYNATSLI